MIRIPSPLLPRGDAFGSHPQMRPLRAAVGRQDWAAVTAYFDGLPPGSDPSQAVIAVGEVRGCERFLQRQVDADPDDGLARLLLGTRMIELAWAARSAARAQYVSRHQFALFYRRLARAERLLSEVTADAPDSVAAWTMRLTTARGLEFGEREARRRYERAAQALPSPFFAQLSLVQQLCPKWGGSFTRVHTFAQKCLREAPPGAVNGAIVADAHLENALESGPVQYLFQEEVYPQLLDAAQQSVLHEKCEPGVGWVRAHNIFASVYALMHQPQWAKPHFAALGRRFTRRPWLHHPDPRRAFHQARRLARRSKA